MAGHWQKKTRQSVRSKWHTQVDKLDDYWLHVLTTAHYYSVSCLYRTHVNNPLDKLDQGPEQAYHPPLSASRLNTRRARLTFTPGSTTLFSTLALILISPLVLSIVHARNHHYRTLPATHPACPPSSPLTRILSRQAFAKNDLTPP